MLHLEILNIDPAYAGKLRQRLADRAHAARLRTPRADVPARRRRPDAVDPADLILVATGQRPIVRTNVDDLVALVLPHGRDALTAPLVLCATIDPTSDALAALHGHGFDVVLGTSAQRDIERHVEALARMLARARGVPRDAAPARAGKAVDAAVQAAMVEDVQAMRCAARHWWSLESLDVASVRAEVERLARVGAPALIRGDHGVGKRHVARVMHEVGRRAGNFVQVAAERLGGDEAEVAGRLTALAELAGGGTLCVTGAVSFREGPAAALRDALAARPHLRLVLTAPAQAAPQVGLAFDGATVDVPPLRQRATGLAGLVRRLSGLNVEGDALAALQAHPWTSNLEELEAVLARSAPKARDGVLELRHLPPVIAALHAERDDPTQATQRTWVPKPCDWQITDDDPLDLRLYERKALLRALAMAGGNRRRAAELVGLAKSTFYRKLQGDEDAEFNAS